MESATENGKCLVIFQPSGSQEYIALRVHCSSRKICSIHSIRTTTSVGHRKNCYCKRFHFCPFSLVTIHKVLTRNEVKSLRRFCRQTGCENHERAIPGDRIQPDTSKTAPGFYPYPAVGDCTHNLALALYSHRTGTKTLPFLKNSPRRAIARPHVAQTTLSFG